MFFSYLLLFIGWLFVFLDQYTKGFFYLYVVVIICSCTFYVGAEIALIIHTGDTTGLRKNLVEKVSDVILVWVLWAAVSGGAGLACIVYTPLQNWLCVTLGCHFGGDMWWFFLTDVSMWCIYKYIIARSQSVNYQNTNGQQYAPLSIR
jgi:hypothetical protein